MILEAYIVLNRIYSPVQFNEPESNQTNPFLFLFNEEIDWLKLKCVFLYFWFIFFYVVWLSYLNFSRSVDFFPLIIYVAWLDFSFYQIFHEQRDESFLHNLRVFYYILLNLKEHYLNKIQIQQKYLNILPLTLKIPLNHRQIYFRIPDKNIDSIEVVFHITNIHNKIVNRIRLLFSYNNNHFT